MVSIDRLRPGVDDTDGSHDSTPAVIMSKVDDGTS
jgi:hypothetical protein